MFMENIQMKSINDLFNAYRLILNNPQLCSSNKSFLSLCSLQIDAYALATIINFYNTHYDLAKSKELWKSKLFIIRVYSIVTSEILKLIRNTNFIDKKAFVEQNNFDDIFALRNKIHQFRYTDFSSNIASLDSNMGRSRDRLTPHLDICLEYLSDTTGSCLFGTNIYQFHFEEAKSQSTINLMQNIIRIVEQQSFDSPSTFIIERSSKAPKYRWEVYCYTDIMKNAAFCSEKVIDRVLLAFDDLCCVSEFFNYTILVDRYLIGAPYLLYFLCKTVAIILDETFDNFKKYIERSPNDNDGLNLRYLMEEIDQNFFNYCVTLRNNLHYRDQQSLHLGTPEELYNTLKMELYIVENLLKRIRVKLNIKPSKAKLVFYRFLRWVQTPSL